MQKISDILIAGSKDRMMAADFYLPESKEKVPVIIYAHGFNGFKDWGGFDRIAAYFTNQQMALLAFNFSHNGTTPDSLMEFADLEAFGQNNYSIQLYDLTKIMDWVVEQAASEYTQLDISKLGLIGHSMGGGMVILQAARDKRVWKTATWAAIAHCKTPWGKWTEAMMETWKKNGVAFYENKRTQQQMPLYYQLYEDFLQHQEPLDILKAAAALETPLLICHGLQDPAVPVESAYLIKMAQPEARLFITDGDHVFGRKHPDGETLLPAEMQKVLEATLSFF